MGAVVMVQCGAAAGFRLPGDGQYLRAFDFEAHGGVGSIELTPNLEEAMHFPDLGAALAFRTRSPVCAPLRADGEPNRPLTAANWEFKALPYDVPATGER